METVFDLKTELPFDENLFDHMKNTAKGLLSGAEKSQYTQAIVLISSKENEYGAVIGNAISKDKAEEEAFLKRLKDACDTEVCCLLCMWEDGNIDLPSIDFRKMLCEASAKNTETQIFVMTQNGTALKKLGSTMK